MTCMWDEAPFVGSQCRQMSNGMVLELQATVMQIMNLMLGYLPCLFACSFQYFYLLVQSLVNPIGQPRQSTKPPQPSPGT